ncbi:MAG TPA: cell wall-binding protein, partial [Clostridiaceae bacterium]|nr:cell wall-binding protein [Clostridiaceae bacterium]
MKSIQKSALAMLLIFIMLFSLMPELYAFDDLTANIKSEGSEVLIEGVTTPDNFVSLVVTRDKDGDRMYASQTKSDAKGDYKFAFQLDKGKYDAVLSSNGIQRLRSFQIKSGAAATATVRAEGIEKTLLPLTEIAIEDGESTLIKTIEKALIKGNVPYIMVGELVQTIDGEDGWQYMLNGKGGQITPATKLNAGDEIVLVRGHLVNPIITKLEVSKNKLELGESFAARLVKIEDGSGPLEDMLVRFEEQEKSTDENGIVTFDTELRGAYKVEAPMEGRLIRPAPVLVEATKEKPRPSYGKMSIKMRIEGYKGTIFDGTIDFDTEDYKGSEGKYIFTDIDGKKYTNSNPTVLLATILALNKANIGNNKAAYNDNYMARISGEEEFDFAKEHSTCGWMIRSNNQLIYEGVGTWPIRDGDSILWTYTAMDAHTGYIEASSQSLKTGEKLIVNVTGRSNRDKDIGGYGHKTAIEGATVYVGDRTYTTDKNGKAEILMDKEGSFEVYALKQDKSSVYKGYSFPLVSKTERVKVVVTSGSSGNDSDKVPPVI